MKRPQDVYRRNCCSAVCMPSNLYDRFARIFFMTRWQPSASLRLLSCSRLRPSELVSHWVHSKQTYHLLRYSRSSTSHRPPSELDRERIDNKVRIAHNSLFGTEGHHVCPHLDMDLDRHHILQPRPPHPLLVRPATIDVHSSGRRCTVHLPSLCQPPTQEVQATPDADSFWAH